MDMKNLVMRVGVFFLLFSCVAGITNTVLSFWDNVHSSAVMEQFYDLPKETVDAVWIGSSSVQEFIIPPVIYEESGISLYALTMGNLPFMSYRFMIEECEKTQDPDLYLVDLRQLGYGLNASYADRVVDNLRLSNNKMDAADYMYSILENVSGTPKRSRLEIVFPFIRYHTRWADLHKEDFKTDNDLGVIMGYLPASNVTAFDKEEVVSRLETEPKPILPEQQKILEDFLDYCDSFDKKVIFTCTPNCLDEDKFAEYNYCKDIIKTRGYEVWDLNEHVDEIGLDYSVDFRDPMHTNSVGAEKVSRFAARHLRDICPLTDHSGDDVYEAWVRMGSAFHELKAEQELRAESDFSSYLERLANLDPGKYTIFMAVKDIQGYQLTEEHTDKLMSLGFQDADILLEHTYHGFLGIRSADGYQYENISYDEKKLHFETVLSGQTVKMDSQTYNNGNMASIQLGIHDYAKNGRGFNIVVVDAEDGELVDSVCFDTHAEDLKCTR